jgi:hypothetical protein
MDLGGGQVEPERAGVRGERRVEIYRHIPIQRYLELVEQAGRHH